MQSHDDNDAMLSDAFKKLFEERGAMKDMESLRPRAEQMVKSGRSEITSGRDGESVLESSATKGYAIQRLPDDPSNVLRISIGGHPAVADSRYLVFRGDPRDVEQLLNRSLKALRCHNSKHAE